MEADTIIAKYSSFINRIRSIPESAPLINKQTNTLDRARNQLKRAIKLDPIFSFNALVNLAYITINTRQPLETYKSVAKFILKQAQKQIKSHILPQLYCMQVHAHDEVGEIIYDDFFKQIQTKIDIIHLCYGHNEQAILMIENSQKLIDVFSNNNGKVKIGRKLYLREPQEFVSNNKDGTIELGFHSLTVSHDMNKKDQALELLNLLPNNNYRVSIDFMDMNEKKMEAVMSKVSLSAVCLNINDLDGHLVSQVIENNRVDLMLIASTEQYLRAVKDFPGKISLDMESTHEQLSSSDAEEYLKRRSEHVKSVSFISIDTNTINAIVGSVQQATFR